MSDADYITPATQEQIARQVADAKKLNGNASLWDIENRRVVRTLANDCVLLTDRVRILREALERVQPYAENELARMEENEFLPEDKLTTEAIRGDVAAGRAALEATKEGV